VDRAAAQLRIALDTVAPQDFRPYQGTPTVVLDIAAAANVFAYQGDLANAAKALDLADQVRREVVKHPAGSSDNAMDESWRRVVLGELYAGVGVPAASLRQVWQSAAEAGRMAAADTRKHLVHSGASAAIGLFTGPSADSTALVEYQAMTGEALYNFSPIVNVLPAAKGGKVRALATSTSKRASAMPELPTIAEAGLPGYAFDPWFGLLTSAKTPRPVLAKLNAEVKRMLGAPDVQKQLVALGAEPSPMSPEAFDGLIKEEIKKFSKIIRDADIKVE